ncbi:prepilin-type N-terminal cleavage/methylation domain-containing protein [Paenibacillus whitsoniae]|uniref:Prepilin-type N-terminal cleavage/methylation domain-containing protein n=1 Tax=Paenibacillus whitsoniae TaxID=2496558 RepID=A0A3S0A6G7_9BACL|nr:prepilin-type N-terminal cleavage/methylation domain-containing protein [Paenibacillus whitsoniae]RTE01414.1 prepilin-type N-terminal cleavage/methylation domain-containing protein [Paenibacillus whitsoniae]
MKVKKSRDEGFTLIEVLAATVILSIASLGMMAFFLHAMSYNKGNQNKTVMINLARNALFYMEKQSFSDLETYFNGSSDLSLPSHDKIDLSTSGCTETAGSLICPREHQILSKFYGIGDVFNPEVNGKLYQVVVTYQESRKRDYLLPISVTVKDTSGSTDSMRYQANVEGDIVDESIR